MPDLTSEQFTDEQLAEWRRVTEVARDSVNDLSDVVKGQYLDWSLAAGSPAGVLKLLDQLEAARARIDRVTAMVDHGLHSEDPDEHDCANHPCWAVRVRRALGIEEVGGDA